MPDSNYPAPFGPLTDEMLFATRAARTVSCAVCAVSRVFQPSPNFACDLAAARWARSPEIGGDIYRCPECSRLGEARAAE
ncbi:MAG: hypothetical protein M3O50_10585 [Myxococcota bacterium]|nr:hypothetical protein [Myxococcota bacterium]